ncbi:MAG: hypothetical protein ACRYG8_18755 [Janthinobacterium lividum]
MAQGDGVSVNTARYQALKAVVESEQAKPMMAKAISEGKPPLCGIDQLITGIIVDYAAKDHQILRTAGSLVAEIMTAKGYVKGPMRPCVGCTVLQASTFVSPTKDD